MGQLAPTRFLADRTLSRALARCVVCLSVCNVLYCGETVRPSEKVSEGVNRKLGSKSSFLGSLLISTSGFAATATKTAVSVCVVLYCGKTVRPSKKVSEGVNRKLGSRN